MVRARLTPEVPVGGPMRPGPGAPRHAGRREPIDAARDALMAALLDRPDDLALLRRLADLYACAGRDDAAALLRRGYVPPCANEEYLGARELAAMTVASSRAAGADCRTVHPSVERRLVEPPRRSRAGVEPPRAGPRTVRTHAAFTVALPGGRVWFDERNLVVTDAEGHLLAEHVRGSGALGYRAMHRREPVHLPGRVCFLDARSTQVYYHFVMDMLPKLGLLDERGIDGIDRFVAPAALPWQRELLAAYGVPPEKVIPSRPLAHYVADELVVPALNNDVGLEDFDGMGLTLQPWVASFHKRAVLGERRGPPRRRVLLSRDPASGRGFARARELERQMARRGFETVRPEALAFADQARLMSEASVVVGAHGSALANCAFCEPSATLIEIFPPGFRVGAFGALADAVGMGYHAYVADPGPAPDPGGRPADPRGLPISIDPAHFASVVDELVGR